MEQISQGPAVVSQHMAPFLLSCLEATGLRAISAGAQRYCIELSEANKKAAAGQLAPELAACAFVGQRFAMPAGSTTGPSSSVPPLETLTADSALGRWIIEQVAPDKRILHALPKEQPGSIHELAPLLFAAYEIDEGRVSLTGCRLEDRPFLRLSFAVDDSPPADELQHCFSASDGTLIDAGTCRSLQLDDVKWTVARMPRLDDAVIGKWVAVARKSCSALLPARMSLVAATIIWSKYVTGKLSFTIGSSTVDLEFAGWARAFQDGSIMPPPFTCSWTGKSSYHLAATDDGRITVAEMIGRCEQSGRRVLKTELQRCAASGKMVLEEFLIACPITGDRVLEEHSDKCAICQQRVALSVLVGQVCKACRNMATISSDDPVMARILGAYPKLSTMRRWKLAETDTVYIAIGTQWWRRILLVLDIDSLQPMRAASAGPLSLNWREFTALQRQEWLE